MIRLEFEQKLPETVPSSLGIYQLAKPQINDLFFVTLFSKLNLMGAFYGFQKKKTGHWTSYTRGQTRIAANHQSGAVRIWTKRNQDRTQQIRFSITDTQVEFIARNYLEKTGLSDIPVPQLQLREINHLRTQSAGPDGQLSEPEMLDAGIVFGREIEKIPVSGPGGYTMVTVGADESVETVTKVQRAIRGEKEKASVIPPNEAIARFTQHLKARNINAKVLVERAELCYFERGKNDLQEILEPAYCFIYSFETSANKLGCKSVFVMPATENSLTNWSPEKRYRANET